MPTTSSCHATVQRAHEPSKEGCRGISTRADDAGWVVSSRPRVRVDCILRLLLSPKPEFSKCIFELKTGRPVIWQRICLCKLIE